MSKNQRQKAARPLGRRLHAFKPFAGHYASAPRELLDLGFLELDMLAHDFALACDEDPDGLADLMRGAALKAQPRAPMTPIVKLVFGADYDKTRLAEYAAVLGHARRHDVPAGGLPRMLEAADGGIKAIVAAERAARRPVRTPDVFERAAAELRALPVLGKLAMGAGSDEFVLLLARAAGGDTVEIIKRVDNRSLVASALKKAAA